MIFIYTTLTRVLTYQLMTQTVFKPLMRRLALVSFCEKTN